MLYLLLFDIDGTLLRSGGAGERALDRACAELYGWESAMEGIRPAGLTDLDIVHRIVRNRKGRDPTQAERNAILDRYVVHLQETVPASKRFRLMPGLPSLLRELTARGDTALGLATGNIRRGARIKLRHAELDSFFPFGGFGNDSADRLELTSLARERGLDHLRGRHPAHPSGEIRTWVIGDSIHDVRCGIGIGARTLAVATGTFSHATLAGAGPDVLLDDLSDVARVVSLLADSG